MTRPRMDHNDLARLLDGTLSEEERGRAVAHLSAFDEDAEVLADAAYLLRETEAADGVSVEDAASGADVDLPTRPGVKAVPEDGGAKVIPLRPPSAQRPRRRIPTQRLALAAVLAGMVLVPLAISRSGSRGPAGPGEFAALLSNRETALSAEWIDQRPWSTTRGGAGGDPLTDTDEGRAARIGVLWVDLELAVASGRPEQADILCGQIRWHLGNLPGGGALAPDCAAIVGEAGQSRSEDAESLRQGREALSEYFRNDVHFALGAWAEAARLAAAARDTGFFQARRSREALDRFARSEEITPAAREGARQVRAQLQAEGAPDWTLLTENLGTLVVEAHRV